MSDLIYLNPFYGHPDPEPLLRDVFTGWNTGSGIFNVLSTVADMPWKDVDTIYETVLDISYFGNHSGGKFCSPLVKLVLDENGEVPATARTTIAKILISKYLKNWQHLWETNVVAYSPIHNYDMTENRVLRTADSEAEHIDDAHTGTNSTEYGKVDTTEHGRTNTEMDYRYGLNTDVEDPKPSDRIDSTEGGDTVTTLSGEDTETRDLLDTRERNKVGAGEEEEEIHRAGNIGVTTTQKLLQEERELWIWNFFDQVFNDLDRELALMFHDSCRV